MTYWTPRQIDNQWRESPWERQERQRKQRAKDRAVKEALENNRAESVAPTQDEKL